jgi:hypothetical protein
MKKAEAYMGVVGMARRCGLCDDAVTQRDFRSSTWSGQ